MKKRPLICLILCVAISGLTAQSADKPNFIVLFADDMGYGDLSSYGHPTTRTPQLDRMAAEGVRLTSFYCGAPVCSPSRAALLTGRYPIHAGMPRNTGPGSDVHLPKGQTLIPQLLKPVGYETMAVGKWHLGHQNDDVMPTGRGFDDFFGLPYSNDMIKPWVQTDRPMYLYKGTTELEEVGHDQHYLTVRYTEAAVSFIQNSAKNRKPFFLYLAYSMPHLPVMTMHERSGRSAGGHYGDVIETIDWSAGRILQELDELGIDKSTLVVFTSDNGPWHNLPDRMLQAGNERWHTGNAGLLRGAKGSTYEGGLRVPGIFRWPSVIPKGRVSSEMASTIDLLPTIAAAAGAKVSKKIDGYDILPFLKGESPSPRNEYYFSQSDFFEAVRQGPWKYRLRTSPEEAELYHVDRDPSEMYNVIDRYPDIAQNLDKALRSKAKLIGAKLRDQ
ncbi:MAG TPA: arylsulfatase [Opitutae bacterium]|nr:arylsulfatase [Opitutaceae bacterium]HCR30159.1 arylsulfatase [Opitutae bacterium]